MPATCKHFGYLSQRLNALSQKFIADQVEAENADPLSYNPDLDKLAAFRLLVHAEIEQFLEAKAREYLDRLDAAIAAGQPWMRQCPGLIGLAILVGKSLPREDQIDFQSFSKFASDVIRGAKGRVSDNNSIKSNAFKFLSLCAGKHLDEVDETVSLMLDAYGRSRGDVAHKSVLHTKSLQAPSAEYQSAVVIVQELGRYFDVAP